MGCADIPNALTTLSWERSNIYPSGSWSLVCHHLPDLRLWAFGEKFILQPAWATGTKRSIVLSHEGCLWDMQKYKHKGTKQKKISVKTTSAAISIGKDQKERCLSLWVSIRHSFCTNLQWIGRKYPGWMATCMDLKITFQKIYFMDLKMTFISILRIWGQAEEAAVGSRG